MRRFQSWWQSQADSSNLRSDGDTPAWVISLFVNIALLVALACFGLFSSDKPKIQLTMDEPLLEEEQTFIFEPELPQELTVFDEAQDEIGAMQENSIALAESFVTQIDNLLDGSEKVEESSAFGEKILQNFHRDVEVVGLKLSDKIVRKGSTGVGTTRAEGAIDRITFEILRSLEEHPTLVVWLFDKSMSLMQQRKAIHDRFDRIYKELGVLETAGNPAFSRHADKPLLTSVVAFGKDIELKLKIPTDHLAEIKAAVASIEADRSGEERVFEAILRSAEEYKRYVGRRRNVMLIVFTDEKGDDAKLLDPTIGLCRKYTMPVYVVGVPAPFGRTQSQVKWVDPDPNYDQSPQWGLVNQGPESRLPEVVKLNYSRGGLGPTMDSGFGPYALTRLSYETGGIYLSVHANRNSRTAVTRQQTPVMSSYLRYFFDPQVMRRYRPDYLSESEYIKMLNANRAKAALVRAASVKGTITPMTGANLRFPKQSEADLAQRLREAQKKAAKLEPKINSLYAMLQIGEPDRSDIESPRWQAGYDLAMGRVMAVKVRTEAYNAMLAKAKTMKFKIKKNDTWILRPANTIEVGSVLEKQAGKAVAYLERVVKEHPETPWAMLAQRELQTPMGWRWQETYTGVNTPRNNPGNGNPQPPQNDTRKRLKKKPPKRKPPPL